MELKWIERSVSDCERVWWTENGEFEIQRYIRKGSNYVCKDRMNWVLIGRVETKNIKDNCFEEAKKMVMEYADLLKEEDWKMTDLQWQRMDESDRINRVMYKIQHYVMPGSKKWKRLRKVSERLRIAELVAGCGKIWSNLSEQDKKMVLRVDEIEKELDELLS